MLRCSKRNAQMDLRLMSDPRPTATTVRHTLARGRYRRLDAPDARHLRAHLLRLHPDDLRSRFMATAPRRMVERYVRGIDWRGSVLTGCVVGRSLRGVCELHPITGSRAEIAVSVERHFQGRGIGTALLSRTLLLARNRGLTALELRCLVDNQRMRRLVGRFDGETAVEAMEACATITSPPPTPATYVTEMVEQAGILGATLIRFWLGQGPPDWPGPGWPSLSGTGRCWATPDLFAEPGPDSLPD
jgi:RimJ/RimL family protein N-acetyltransferase